MDRWVDGSIKRFKDCLQQSKSVRSTDIKASTPDFYDNH